MLDQQNKLGDTPLHSASWGGSAKCAELLLSHASAKNNKDAMMNLLMTKNADGRTAVDLARNMEVGSRSWVWVRRVAGTQLFSALSGRERDQSLHYSCPQHASSTSGGRRCFRRRRLKASNRREKPGRDFQANQTLCRYQAYCNILLFQFSTIDPVFVQ